MTILGIADIYRYCYFHQGYRFGDGECLWLAHYALVANGYKTFTQLGPVGYHADYVWGTPIPYSEAGPGCIVQFKNVSFNWVYNRQTYTWSQAGAIVHHTAVIANRVGNDFWLFEQNYTTPKGQIVRSVGCNFCPLSHARSGYVWFYVPRRK